MTAIKFGIKCFEKKREENIEKRNCANAFCLEERLLIRKRLFPEFCEKVMEVNKENCLVF